jgi:hypothetical protein
MKNIFAPSGSAGNPRSKNMSLMLLILFGGVGIVFVFFILPRGCGQGPSIPELAQDVKETYVNFVTSHYQTPEDFVIKSFDNHDVIFIGDFFYYFGLKQNVGLIRNLVPLLHKKGITTIGIEQLFADDQKEIDGVLTAADFDETKIKKILINYSAIFGYQEYYDLLKGIWTLNKSLSPAVKPMRVVGLNMNINLEYLTKDEDKNNPEVLKKVLNNTVQEQFIFDVIDREILQKKEKALLFMRQYYCLKDVALKERSSKYGEMGLAYTGTPAMLVRARIGDRAMVVFLHNLWIRNDNNSLEFPLEGVMDAVLHELTTDRWATAFTITDSPFKNLAITTSFIQKDDAPIAFSSICDAYILNGPLYLYRTTPMMSTAIDDGNLPQVKKVLGIEEEADKKMTRDEFVAQLDKQVEKINDYMSKLPY